MAGIEETQLVKLLGKLIEEVDAEHVTVKDADLLLDKFRKDIRDLDQARGNYLPSVNATMGSRGRIVIPEKLRELVGGMEKGDFVQLFPEPRDPDKARGILLVPDKAHNRRRF